MDTYKIAHYPGDGIGVDVSEAAIRVLAAVEEKVGGFSLEYERFDWGADAYYETHGCIVPEDYIERLRPFDAIFLGAIGWPERLPDHVTLVPIIQIRQQFDLYACVRPARTFAGVPNPLRCEKPIDMVVVRENSEGEYIQLGGRFHRGKPEETALQSALHSRKGIERILRYSFDLAMTRRRKLTLVTKSNALVYGYVLWDEVFEEICPEFPNVEVEKLHIDAATMQFVLRPSEFDVVVASNLFGDILTDLTGAVTGSLGINPSANLDPERRFPSLFEPVHGSAPDIAGKGIANPVGAILSGAMMLDWLGQKEAAETINLSVEQTLAAGLGTPDIGGRETTASLAERIVDSL